MKLLQNSTSVALWRDIILEAEAACKVFLKADLESYLVFLLIRYTNKPEVVKQIIATEFLKGLDLLSTQRQVILQGVGDKCLLLSGLFPGVSQKRLVKLSYFIKLGQSAYATISSDRSDLYSLLATQFVPLMDILQSIRHDSAELLLPLEAYELWVETGSRAALQSLKHYTDNIPILINLHENDHNLNK